MRYFQAGYQRAKKNRALENKVSSITLNVYHYAGIEEDDDFRRSLENHAIIGEIRIFSNKNFDTSHDMHSAIIEAKNYWKPSNRGEYQYVSGVMGIS